MKNFSVLLWIFYSLSTSNAAMAIEEPNFNLIVKENAFELRAYQPKIIAEVSIDADMSESSSKGFRLIADFIFGNNTSREGGSEKISMTAPVSVYEKYEQISMTAPAGVQQVKDGWKVYFVMPSKYTLDSLPKPNNAQVSIKQIPAKKIAVIRFSGLVDEEKMNKKVKDLNEWIVSKNLKAMSIPELARYNPPWTLPFLRRNEVMIEVD
ncbi:MAG: heme-binding protein [Methylophilaceae bacterium]